ncbi:MAG: hypothetical protein QF664_02790 [Dehalococcoidia bacterium]|nr:hypothetical protein [Dehalococcoidia bacterium]
MARITDLLASPGVVAEEFNRATAHSADEGGLADTRRRIEALGRQRSRLARLYQMGEIDDAYLEREISAVREQQAQLEARVESAAAPSVELPRDRAGLEKACSAVRQWVEAEAAAGRLGPIAQALQIDVRLQRSDDETHGTLSGVVPRLPTHHCTNIGMMTWT